RVSSEVMDLPEAALTEGHPIEDEHGPVVDESGIENADGSSPTVRADGDGVAFERDVGFVHDTSGDRLENRYHVSRAGSATLNGSKLDAAAVAGKPVSPASVASEGYAAVRVRRDVRKLLLSAIGLAADHRARISLHTFEGKGEVRVRAVRATAPSL